MTPVLMAAALCVGVLIGLRVNARRLATLREQLRMANKVHSAYITSAHNEDLAEVGPVTGASRPVEMFDQDADPLAFAASVGREHAAVRPPAMTAARDTEAQDRELVDIYRIGEDWRTPVEPAPCEWSDGGPDCGEPSAGLAELTPGEPVPLCATHYQWACHGTPCLFAEGCPHPDRCGEGCVWHRGEDAADDSSLPRVLPDRGTR